MYACTYHICEIMQIIQRAGFFVTVPGIDQVLQKYNLFALACVIKNKYVTS